MSESEKGQGKGKGKGEAAAEPARRRVATKPAPQLDFSFKEITSVMGTLSVCLLALLPCCYFLFAVRLEFELVFGSLASLLQQCAW
jgi:hypothetical protein